MSKTPSGLTGRLGKQHANNGTADATPHKDVIKREFGKRLYNLLVDQGMTQTEFAIKAAKYMPDKKLGRDLVSSYISGRYIPSPITLEAMARALKVSAEELLPQAGNLPRRGEATPPIDLRILGENRASLRVNQVIPLDDALKIVQILNDITIREKAQGG